MLTPYFLYSLKYLEQIDIHTSILSESSGLIRTSEHPVYLVAQDRRVQKCCVEIVCQFCFGDQAPSRSSLGKLIMK